MSTPGWVDERADWSGSVQAEVSYRAIVEQQDELICRFRPDGRLTFVNGAAARYFGRPPAELVGQDLLAFIPADERPAVVEFFAALSLAQPRGVLEHTCLGQDGAQRWHQWTTGAIFDADGRLLELQSVGRDMTERKRAEAERERRYEESERALARRAALLRLARELSSEADPRVVLAGLLDDAVALVGGDGGCVQRWDERRSRLIPVRSTEGDTVASRAVVTGDGAARQAIERPGTVILNDYPRSRYAGPRSAEGGVQAVMAVPLLHDARRLGALAVYSRSANRQFTFEDAEVLEILAGIAAATLDGLERAQLQAVALAARELVHLLNNDLALAVGTLDLLRHEPVLPAPLAELVQDSAARLTVATRRLAQLQQLVRFETKDTVVGPALDLERSVGPRTVFD